MFTILLVKEWKDKAVIVLFGLVMLAAFAAAFVVLEGETDLREIVATGFLTVFFPAIGAILGAGAFESEFRDGAWAYLLSRPVRKETVWLAKLAALLAVLAVFWLIFLGLTAAVPGLDRIVGGYTLPEFVGAAIHLLPLVLLTSLFFFSVAFSLSVLSEKLLGLVLGSIFLGAVVQTALTSIAVWAERTGLLSKGWLYPWLAPYKLALVLSCLAFLAASLVTFRRTDFSQPKRKAATLAVCSALFLIIAWGLAALWPALRPGRPEEFDSGLEIVGDNAYFATTRGFYRYDIERGSLKKVVRWTERYSQAAIGGGKLLYMKWDDQSGYYLNVMNLDGKEDRTLLGPGTGDGRWDMNLWPLSLALSPDGRRAAVTSMKRDEEGHSRPDAVWIVPTDGSGKIEPLRFDPALRAQMETTRWFRIVAWESEPDSLVLLFSDRDAPSRLWNIDLVTGAQRLLFEAARIGFRSATAPNGSIFVTYWPDTSWPRPTGPVVAAVIDSVSGKSTEVARVEETSDLLMYGALSSPSWSANGQDLALLIQERKGFFIPIRFSFKDGQAVVANGEPVEASSSGIPGISWASGDTRLVLALPRERSLKVLDRDLKEVKRIDFPTAVANMEDGRAIAKGVLLLSGNPQGVWRLDLDTGKWKRIWGP
jgi:ABC-type transport system involved in multi-copper enzyme maturation permease subunit